MATSCNPARVSQVLETLGRILPNAKAWIGELRIERPIECRKDRFQARDVLQMIVIGYSLMRSIILLRSSKKGAYDPPFLEARR